ncbi:GntR family transcriptional regulator [Luteococcus sp. H138]|uniref:GntR family transcriptional regulator n=1 Tax=unclassified Luteococcus TaxID=2639923 RepID=UPI00313F28D5
MAMEHREPPRVERCFVRLADGILAGGYQPGQRLDEVQLGERLAVSRNTLREAFRMLAHEQLVEHHPNRGVFVRRIGPEESRHLFAVRRHLELGALDDLAARAVQCQLAPDSAALERLVHTVVLAARARDRDDWVGVGTANALFHMALVELADNPVASRLMRIVTAQTRLRYLTLGNPRAVHESFLDENQRIADLLRAGQLARARGVLELYLLRAEEELS